MSTNTNLIYHRVLLKISGEILQGVNKFGIDIKIITRIAKEIKCLVEMGLQIGLVIGSGNLFRGVELSQLGINRIISDHIGILSTTINSLAMQDVLHSISLKSCIMSSIPIHGICKIYHWKEAIDLLSKKTIVIFSGGTGNPLFTTDSAACLRSIEIQSDVLLKGTKVDGVYSKDPKKNIDAVFYKNLKYKDVLKKELKVMDLTAFTLARDHNLPIRVFNINKSDSLYRMVTGYDEGTLITA